MAEAFLYTLPAWIYVDTEEPPSVFDGSHSGMGVRFYPPFRSGPANYIPMPEVNFQVVPWLEGARPNIASDFRMPTMAMLPLLPGSQRERPTMSAVWGPTWEESPDPFPMDSLRIDIYYEGDQSKAGTELASNLLTHVLHNVRLETHQWWIGHSVHGLLGYLRHSFLVGERGEARELPAGSASGRVPRGDEVGLNDHVWTTALEAVLRGDWGAMHRATYLDARYFVSISDYRRAVIELAVACEQAKDLTFERLWNESQSRAKYRPGRIMRSYDLPSNIGRDLQRAFGRSYESEHSDEYHVIQRVWECRGSVAHGGSPSYRRNGVQVAIDREESIRMVEGVDHCLGWLEGL
jgi:hypothetical protein